MGDRKLLGAQRALSKAFMLYNVHFGASRVTPDPIPPMPTTEISRGTNSTDRRITPNYRVGIPTGAQSVETQSNLSVRVFTLNRFELLNLSIR